MPLIPEFRRQRLAISESQASFVYSASSRKDKATQRNLVSKNQNQSQTKSNKTHVSVLHFESKEIPTFVLKIQFKTTIQVRN